jgi:hypothetical protein
MLRGCRFFEDNDSALIGTIGQRTLPIDPIGQPIRFSKKHFIPVAVEGCETVGFRLAA